MTASAKPAPVAGRVEVSASARRLGANLLLLTGGEFLSKIVTFLAFSYLARVLGPSYYGQLEFTLAVMVFFTLPADLGLGSYGAREIARNPQHARTLLGQIIELRVLLSVMSLVALLAFIWIMPKPFEIKVLLTLYGASLLALGLDAAVVFPGSRPDAVGGRGFLDAPICIRASSFHILSFGYEYCLDRAVRMRGGCGHVSRVGVFDPLAHADSSAAAQLSAAPPLAAPPTVSTDWHGRTRLGVHLVFRNGSPWFVLRPGTA
jgi:hypothetical protein